MAGMIPISSIRARTSALVITVPLYYCSAVACKTRAFDTTFWPGSRPVTISCRLPGSIFPPVTSRRRANLRALRGNIYPVAIVQMQHCRRGHRGMRLFLQAVKRRGDKHAQPHLARIRHFQAHLGRTEVGIENRADVPYMPFKDAVGISVQPHVPMTQGICNAGTSGSSPSRM